MSTGLCGTHRTGKSTLARAYALESGVPFLETGASATFARLGLDPKADYPLDVRLNIQKHILDDLDKKYASARDFITDRTPVDAIAYMLADVQRQNTTPVQAKQIVKYMEDCASVTNTHFTTLVVLQPGIAVVEEEGKAPANVAYMEHISALVMGLVVSEIIIPHHYYIPRRMTDLGDRVKCLKTITGRTLEKHQAYIQQRAAAGEPVVFH